MAPLLVLTSPSQTFDPIVISHWEQEGFNVQYNYFTDARASIRSIESASEDLEDDEKYAIIAYGKAATALIQEIYVSPIDKLAALIIFYPEDLPDITTPPKGPRLQVHLAGDQLFAPRYFSYTYKGTQVGFAQSSSGVYDKIATSIAWSRTLSCLQKAFDIESDLEFVWDAHLAQEFLSKDPEGTLKTMVANPYVNHIPTLTGGIGARDLHRFYAKFFIPANPSSLTTKLISRTVGADRVVDEMIISFTHTQDIPWILPGVPPTNKYVEVALVSVVRIRGGKLCHEHLYWDQASVLVQIGLLDPKLGAVGLGKNGVNVLPIVGIEAARKVVDETSVPSNELIPDW